MRVFKCLTGLAIAGQCIAQQMVDVPVGEAAYVRSGEPVVQSRPSPAPEAKPAAREEPRRNLVPSRPVLRGRIGSPASGGLAPMMPDMRSLRRAQVLEDFATGPWTSTGLLATSNRGVKSALGVFPNPRNDVSVARVGLTKTKGYCALPTVSG